MSKASRQKHYPTSYGSRPCAACKLGSANQHERGHLLCKINITGAVPDIVAIEQAIGAVDPSALVDIDAAGRTLRVAAAIDAAQLFGLIGQAGYAVTSEQLQRVPSERRGQRAID